MNARQLSIHDITQAAIDRAEAAANPEWICMAKAILVILAKQRREFTTDEIWRSLQDANVGTKEPRALGALMRKAEKARLIEKIPGKWIKSTRPECHHRPLQVWRGKCG